jgi:hypothetical protein
VNRPLVALAGALALTIAASACSTTNPDAATVNGTHISRKVFEDDLHSLVTNDGFLKLNDTNITQGTPSALGDTKGTASGAFASAQLQNLIMLQLIHTELATRKVTPDADAITNGEKVGQGILSVSDPAVWATLPAALRTKYSAMGADYLTLKKALAPASEADIAGLYASVQNQLELCVSHILVATEDDAKAAAAEIKQGAKFEDVAKTRSTDTGSKDNGGNLSSTPGSCPTGADLDADFVAGARALKAVGDVSDPVKSQFGYHLIRLDKPIQTMVDLHDQLVEYGGQQATTAFMRDGTKAAKVTIDPRYGTWDAAQGAITTNKGAAGTAAAGVGTTVAAPAAGAPATTIAK